MMRRVALLLLCGALAMPAAPTFASQDTGAEAIAETYRFKPKLPRNSGVGRRVVYSNTLQWVWAIDKDENIVRSMPVSGRRGVPEVGTYLVT